MKKIAKFLIYEMCQHKPIVLKRLDSRAIKVSCIRCGGLFILHENPGIYELWSQNAEYCCVEYAKREQFLNKLLRIGT